MSYLAFIGGAVSACACLMLNMFWVYQSDRPALSLLIAVIITLCFLSLLYLGFSYVAYGGVSWT